MKTIQQNLNRFLVSSLEILVEIFFILYKFQIFFAIVFQFVGFFSSLVKRFVLIGRNPS